ACRRYRAPRLILYSSIFRLRVLRWMPSVPAVLVRLPSQRLSTLMMNRFSNSRTASSNCTPLSTISSTRCSSRSEIIAGLVELPGSQAPERLDVLVSRVKDDLFGQRRPGRLFVPADLLEVVADELFVEAGLRSAGRVLIARPEARRVRRERLVDENHALLVGSGAIGEEAEFELGVGDDDAAGFGVGGAFGVQAEGEIADAIEEGVADHRARLGFGDVDVVAALPLGCRGGDWLGQPFRLAESGRQPRAADF